jgi:small subunit ribosomal protein S20
MNKKQKNRKLVTQNKRNRMINRRYSSTIKTLSKLFASQLKIILSKPKIEENKKLCTDILKIRNQFYSAVDKAVKKGVIHKNTASRKKSKVSFLSKNVQY